MSSGEPGLGPGPGPGPHGDKCLRCPLVELARDAVGLVAVCVLILLILLSVTGSCLLWFTTLFEDLLHSVSGRHITSKTLPELSIAK